MSIIRAVIINCAAEYLLRVLDLSINNITNACHIHERHYKLKLSPEPTCLFCTLAKALTHAQYHEF